MQRIFDPVLKFFEQPQELIDLNAELNQLSYNLAEKINAENETLKKVLGDSDHHERFLEETLPEWHNQLLTMNEYLRAYPSSYFLTNHQKIQAAQDAMLAYTLIDAISKDPTMQEPRTKKLLKDNPLLKIRNKHIRQGTFIVLAGLAVFAALIFLAISVSPMLPLFFF